MVTTSLVVGLSLVLSQAPEKIELGPKKASLLVVSDGAKHFLVIEPGQGYSSDLFWGDGKTFTKLRVKGGGGVGTERFDAYFWDPRFMSGGGSNTSLAMRTVGKAKEYEIECGKKKTKLSPLPPDEGKKLLEGATFTGPSWLRLPERLLRDDHGTYYLIDRLRTDDAMDRRDFRLFVGAKGKMKAMPLKDVVDDSEGMIFATKEGDLRLVTNKRAPEGVDAKDKQLLMKWVANKAETALIDVPLDEQRNVRLVYLELGPYDGQRLGTPCDDLS